MLTVEGASGGLREVFDPDVIMRAVEGWPEPGPFVGREAVMRQFRQQRETWDADTIELIGDLIDAADRVVVRFIWRGAGYGPEADLEMTGVYTVRKRKISASSTSGTTLKPSKPWGCRSKSLTPTPEPAGYCAGDVAGERRGRASSLRGVQRGGHGWAS